MIWKGGGGGGGGERERERERESCSGWKVVGILSPKFGLEDTHIKNYTQLFKFNLKFYDSHNTRLNPHGGQLKILK